ncbi:GNAT family N-acetyltransferase [Phenylobacterium immobile]|uniref:GNAT family N-acetyltransferase n=1 Tax=Phenylobacterium immobile TaxID=21 RepID=UPI000ACC2C70|nr:GNAT family N-acetyltransferase [Phenylobacterium immobile]
MIIRTANPQDHAAIWSIIGPVIGSGETYALERRMNETEALAYWFGADKQTFVAEHEGEILGTYYLRANQAGGGGHVCNAGFMTAANATGRGVARTMAQHAMAQAKVQGFLAMQFNLVVITNERAVRLWRSLGFETVGRLPRAFDHPTAGLVDALVMFRAL